MYAARSLSRWIGCAPVAITSAIPAFASSNETIAYSAGEKVDRSEVGSHSRGQSVKNTRAHIVSAQEYRRDEQQAHVADEPILLSK